MAKHAKNSSQSPHFFRIILTQILENGTLELPRNFVKEYWKSFSKYACLKVPTGSKSKMKMKRCNGRAWLHKGWQDFVEKHSIKCGYFLLFRYEGGSDFDVQIFDLSTLEIEYAKKGHKKEVDVEIKEEECDDDDDEPRKLESGQNSSSMKNKSLCCSARDRVLERANAFRSPNPHFRVIIKPAYVSNCSYMHIPKNAARSYFGKKGNNDIYLSIKGGDGRVWSMKYYVGAPPDCPARISSGWSKFSQENNLQEGDICTFEMVSSTDAIFKVTVFRIADEQVGKSREKRPIVMSDIASPRGTKKATNQEQIRKRKRDSFKCDETSFSVIMRKTYVQDHCRLLIPNAHASRYLMDRHQNKVVLHRLDGETWPVTCYARGPGIDAKFSRGWKDFVVDNDLQLEDSCVFELIPGVANHYQVTIFRVA